MFITNQAVEAAAMHSDYTLMFWQSVAMFTFMLCVLSIAGAFASGYAVSRVHPSWSDDEVRNALSVRLCLYFPLIGGSFLLVLAMMDIL